MVDLYARNADYSFPFTNFIVHFVHRVIGRFSDERVSCVSTFKHVYQVHSEK